MWYGNEASSYSCWYRKSWMMSSCPLGWLKKTKRLQWISHVRCCRRIRCDVFSCRCVCGVWCVECGVWSVVCGVSRCVCMYVEKGRNLKPCVVTTVNFLHCCKAHKYEVWNHRSAYTWLADGRMRIFDKGGQKGSVVGGLRRLDTWSANEQSWWLATENAKKPIY